MDLVKYTEQNLSSSGKRLIHKGDAHTWSMVQWACVRMCLRRRSANGKLAVCLSCPQKMLTGEDEDMASSKLGLPPCGVPSLDVSVSPFAVICANAERELRHQKR